MLLHCLLALTTTSAAAYQLAVAPLRTEQARQPRLLRRACPLFCEYAAGSAGSSDVHGAVDVGPERDVDRPALLDSSALLDALDHWLRRQSISTVLPKSQAKQLLRDLRDDQRFWAQQRRQFARAWVLFEAGLRAETRPVGTLLGKETSAKILSVAEEMETDPVLVNAVVRSEIVEVPPPPVAVSFFAEGVGFLAGGRGSALRRCWRPGPPLLAREGHPPRPSPYPHPAEAVETAGAPEAPMSRDPPLPMARPCWATCSTMGSASSCSRRT